MNSSDVKWVQGAIVLYIDPAAVVDTTKLVRDTDYVLLQMMGKIKHRASSLPPIPKNIDLTPKGGWDKWLNWPY
ncbi:hypothetical protein [Ralstonia mannitolilytica]|uniref:hypothetical protein n=1 Tax=Ralstonia mannitolilytica TaxID=105219 RepID=UPI000786CF7E|nr:hypothetical protein [Ralstonia mannitolilytica]